MDSNNLLFPLCEAAVSGMLLEVSTTPKPGLVDRNNSGAHRDMDFNFFMRSTASISFYMYEFAKAGFNHDGDLKELIYKIKPIGIKAEENMFKETHGVNTQKGIIYLMGLVCTSSGFLIKQGKPFNSEDICSTVSNICKDQVEDEFKSISKKESLSSGERIYLKYGIKGVRGEASKGLPCVVLKGLPFLKEGLLKGLSLNDSMVQSLIGIMSLVEDTTVISRHNADALYDFVHIKAKEALDLGGMFTKEGKEAITEMDKLFIENNVSPGGAADLLAVTYAIYDIENKYKK